MNDSSAANEPILGHVEEVIVVGQLERDGKTGPAGQLIAHAHPPPQGGSAFLDDHVAAQQIDGKHYRI